MGLFFLHCLIFELKMSLGDVDAVCLVTEKFVGKKERELRIL